MATERGKPLQLVELKFGDKGDKPSADVNQEALDILTRKLRAMDAKQIALVSVMGAFRGGKSFMLDLFLRYLRYEDNCIKEGVEPEKFNPPERGLAEDGKTLKPCPLPAWITASPKLEGSGNEPDGFKCKGGMDACTEGIWVWSDPFLRVIDGKNVALLLMDTQGAWDSTMTKEQSATIFGLTAVLSSKLIYNVHKQVQENYVDNLTYFMRFAQSAIQKASADMKEDNTQPIDVDRPFQNLDFLVRDWSNYKKDFTTQQCRDQCKEHISRHVNAEREESTGALLANMFQNVGCSCLPHPGHEIEDEDWDGDLSVVNTDFLRMADFFIRDVFQTHLSAKQILGADLSPLTFPLIVKDFVRAFQDAAPSAMTFTQAITNSTVLMSKEQSMKSFTTKMDEEFAKNARGFKPEAFIALKDKLVKEVEESYKRMTIFGTAEVRQTAWDEIKESLATIAKRYSEDNDRRLEKALAAFANVTIVAISLFVLDRVSDWTCDWWSETCVQLSKLMLMGYSFIFLYLGVHVYFLYNEQGKLGVATALGELWKESVKLLGVYSELVKAVNWKEFPDVAKKVATGKLDEVLREQEGKRAATNKKKD